MSLKAKAGLIFLSLFLIYGIAHYTVQKYVVLPSFIELEASEATKDLQRAVEAIQREIHHLDHFCWDWASWDDTYKFMLSRSPDYIQSNLVLGTFADNAINLIYYLNTSGEVVWGKIYGLEREPPVQLNLPTLQRSLQNRLPAPGSGIMDTEKGPMLVAARPILTSEDKGPIRGTLIMGRFLDHDLINTLVDQAKVIFSIHPARSNPSHERKKETGTGAEDETYRIQYPGDSRLLVSTTLPDVTGNPSFGITATVPRTISTKGYDTTRYALMTGLGSMLLVLVMMLFVLRQTLLKPIVKLKNHVLSIGRTGDLSARLSMKQGDEIGALALEFDRMMEKLEDKTDKLKHLNDKLKEDMQRRIEAEEALRKSEESLLRAKKMESLGLMAGGIAHDLNNILSGIVSYPELLLMELPEESPLRKPLMTIQDSGMRAAEVVADLLTIARGVATGKEILNLNAMVHEYMGSLEHQKLVRGYPLVHFQTKLDPHLLNISGSPVHIKKALMNLMLNAAEAIEQSGAVTLSTLNRNLHEPLKGYEDVRPGEYVLLQVADTGSGIGPQDLDRIFEPFYTKKVVGRSGTGLGLAIVWNMIQGHEGYIDVKSDRNGTVFELYFPVSREERPLEKQESPGMEDYMGRGERILVVDDEETQREIACSMLAKLGYRAESVSSGEAAIAYVKKHPVDLIVLDMVMPKGINGQETYAVIIRIRPHQKAILASGYAETREVHMAQQAGAGKFIKKPYTLEEIGLAVKEEMEK